jgi:iron complex outermembrane receptor protein
VNTIADGGTGGGLKAAMNVPLGDAAAMRMVAYGTRFGGWIDALGPGGGKDVNRGERTGGRLTFTVPAHQGRDDHPAVVYQKVTAEGFNRQEVFNLYANRSPPRYRR